MSSTTITRLWDSAVEWSRPIASVAVWTAVWNPKVTDVAARSLSMVFGTPTIFTPRFASCDAIRSDPSPPTAIRASTPRASSRATTSSPRSTISDEPSSRTTRQSKGFPRLVVPRMVPPRWVMPRTSFAPRGITPSSSPERRPSYPFRIPSTSHPRPSADRTTARITALSPGASPPPVLIAMRMRACLPLWFGADGSRNDEGGARPSGRTPPPRCSDVAGQNRHRNVRVPVNPVMPYLSPLAPSTSPVMYRTAGKRS